jgi:nucleoid-associated protein YgaU
MMMVTPTARVVVPTLALVGACGAGLLFGITHARHVPSVQAEAEIAAPIASPGSPGVQNPALAGLAQAQADATAVMGAVSTLPSSVETDDIPAFDIARIGPTGEAVIAGRASPSAIVELLLDGKVFDQAVADKSGQFVMTPPRLPPGEHDLTLRSGPRDGKQVTSIRNVALHLSPSEFSQLSQPAQIAEPRKLIAAPKLASAAATPLLEPSSHPVVAASKTATTVVAGGDSLWRISLAKYGKGDQYSAIYDANRSQIRNPDRIFPGQRIVIPDKAR